MTKVLMNKCPECKEKFNYYNSDSRPFCSERCKNIDLGLWLTGSYSIPDEKLRRPESPMELDKDFDLGENFKDVDEGYSEDE